MKGKMLIFFIRVLKQNIFRTDITFILKTVIEFNLVMSFLHILHCNLHDILSKTSYIILIYLLIILIHKNVSLINHLQFKHFPHHSTSSHQNTTQTQAFPHMEIQMYYHLS